MKTNFISFNEGHIICRSEKINFTSVDLIKPGLYKHEYISLGMFDSADSLQEIKLQDGLVDFKSGIVGDILNRASAFFSESTREIYKEMEMAHKMGIILEGRHGTGKTSTVFLLAKCLAEEHNAIMIDFTGKSVDTIISTIKYIQKYQDNPILCFVDEIDTAIYDEEHNWLTFLDGANSLVNVITIGCTNYLSKIPKRIKDRPSRIKKVFTINSLEEEVYRKYVQNKWKDISTEDLYQISYKASELGLTIDELKNALLEIRTDGISIENALNNVKPNA